MAERGLRLGALFAVLVLGPAAAPAAAPDIEPSRAVGGTHDCAAYYPDISRMLSESGDVQVGYDVAADGAISNVKVVRSSGFERLDRAAVQCVSRNWRNTPARRNGVPVASPDHPAII
ncbi:MAG TPA: energy transducer TonB, partial [Rhizomicrobium sp.]